MDYEQLYEILPRRPEVWSTQDIVKWLEFISLPTLTTIFKEAGIDGSCICLLDEDSLRN